ncbi:MAG TPA: sugar phosphate isomerase/epimerase [Candidatus Avimonas sp.]|nr:sugar phosphate isomerase/epimerase [Candidatus Avimonas sp.]
MDNKLPIALQLYSVRDDMKKDFKGTLTKVKEMGYQGVEFAGLFGHSPSQVKAMLDEIGLTPISAHVAIDEILADIPKVISDYRTVGCRFIAIPWLVEERRPGNPRYQQTIEDIKAIGEEANKQGLTLLYHNHDFEFKKLNGEYLLDILYRDVPEDLLKTQIDTCWANVGGEDPAEYLRKYKGRSPLVHLKDFVMPGKKPAKLYELIGVESEQTEDEQDKKFELRPLGYGVQDIPEILKAAAEAGAEWVIVEQDHPSMNKTPMECAKISIDFLKSL